MTSIRQVTDPDDPAIAAFGRVQSDVYFAPETLIPASYLPSLLEGPSAERLNVLLVAEVENSVVGGAVFHAFAQPRTGFSSFLGVRRDMQGKGIARMLHEARFEALEHALDGPVEGVFIDVVSPARQSASERRREARVGSDACARRRAFQRLGFRQVDIRYEQPVGGPGGGPVTTLDLLYCPRQSSSSVATRLVVETMRAYWSPWLGAKRAAWHAQRLEARASGKPALDLLPSDAECLS